MKLLGWMMLVAMPALAQGTRVCVSDGNGSPLVGALVSGSFTGADGCVAVHGGVGPGSVTAAGFAFASLRLGVGGEMDVMMLPIAAQTVTVTASRGALDFGASASSVRLLTQTELQQTPGFTLDDQLRTVPGLQLFRRSSSWVSNPTAQGISLRGLGSTSASRTLVVTDQVPLNDPFQGTLHWDEIPQLAVQSVEVLRGGAADLYGSSAIGGVIDVTPVRAGGEPRTNVVVDGAGASEDTELYDALVKGGVGKYDALAAATVFRTAGFITTAPEQRGPVDEAANVHDQAGRVELRRSGAGGSSAFVRGNVMNEARNNGTPDTTNGTRIWRYAGGGDLATEHAGRGFLRVYGSDEEYRQSFSSVNAARTSETLTKLQNVPAQELGAAAQWAKEFFGKLTVAGGADARDVRATDNEKMAATGSVTSISARQREVGVYGEAIWQTGRWSVALSGRVDNFRTFDGRSIVSLTHVASAEPVVAETVASPKLGVVRELGHGLAATGSVSRSFRGPTLNELYRTGQVAAQTTLANPNLISERATGFEFGLRAQTRAGTLQGGYFWTEVNRPIVAILLSQSGAAQTLMRENLGQLRSRGWTVEADSARWHGAELSAGYQYAKATVTSDSAETTLVGKRIAQVPRDAANAKLAWSAARVGSFNVTAYYTGKAFDDSENTELLRGYARFDAYGEHHFGNRWMVYGSVQNLLNRRIEVGRTPLLTLAQPVTALGGIRFMLH